MSKRLLRYSTVMKHTFATHLLKQAVDILIRRDYSLRVLHITGDQNTVADALSRVQFSIALGIEPDLKLFTFHPPGLVGTSI